MAHGTGTGLLTGWGAAVCPTAAPPIFHSGTEGNAMECENCKRVYRPYVSTTWRDAGKGLIFWIDECVLDERVMTRDGRPMAWTSSATLAAVGGDWSESKADCEREVIKSLRAKAQEILDQATELESKLADH